MRLSHRLASLWVPAIFEEHALRKLTRPSAVFLMYHEVLPDSFEVPSWMVVRESSFAAQMAWLRERFDVVSPDVAFSRLRAPFGLEPMQRPMAVVTFDDGFSGNLSCVLPVMRRLGLPFTVYVASAALHSDRRFWHDDVACALLSRPAGRLDIPTSRGTLRYVPSGISPGRRWTIVNRILDAMKKLPAEERLSIADSLGGKDLAPGLRMLTSDELTQLSREPLVTIGNHTHGHELLDQLSAEETRETIQRAQIDLEALTGEAPRHFCYPNGNFCAETVRIVGDLGFTTATTTAAGLWCSVARCLEIPRLSVSRFDSLAFFRARALGLCGLERV